MKRGIIILIILLILIVLIVLGAIFFVPHEKIKFIDNINWKFWEKKETFVLSSDPVDAVKSIYEKMENVESYSFVFKKNKEEGLYNFIMEGIYKKPDSMKGLLNENLDNVNDSSSYIYQEIVIVGEKSYSRDLGETIGNKNINIDNSYEQFRDKWFEDGPLLYFGFQEWYAIPPSHFSLLKFVKDCRKLADEEIEGKLHYHYLFQINVEEANKDTRLKKDVDVNSSELLFSSEPALELTGEIWIDSQTGFIKKMKTIKKEKSISFGDEEKIEETNFEITYSDFNKDVVIHLPDKEEVYTIDEMIQVSDEGMEKKRPSSPDGLEIHAVAVSQTDNNIIYVAAHKKDISFDHLFKSLDGGKTWQRISKDKEIWYEDYNKEIKEIIVHPKDPNFINVLSSGDNGLFKSSDGGETWVVLKDNEENNIYWPQSITLDSEDINTVYITGHKSYDKKGILKSTDGAKTWEYLDEKVEAGMETTLKKCESENIAVTPTYTQYLYISCQTRQLLKSNDYGETWFTIFNGQKEKLDILTNLVLTPKGQFMTFSDYYGILKSTDYGNSWVRINWPEINQEKIDYYIKHQLGLKSTLIYDGQNPEKLYYYSTLGIFESIDNGETWSVILEPKGEDWAEISKEIGKYFSLAIDSQNNILYYSNPNGLKTLLLNK